MQNRHKLKIAILQALGITALSGLSMEASAVSYWTDLGATTPTSTIIATDASAGKRAWTDYGAVNRGWTHTGSFFTFQVGSASDITAGNRFNVSIDALSTLVGTSGAMANPGFSVWTSGTAPTTQPFSSQLGYGHHWNQVRGSFDGGIGGAPCAGGVFNCSLGTNGWLSEDYTANGAASAGNIVSGHDGWIGFANSGYGFKNADNDFISGRLTGATNPLNKNEYGNGGTGSVGGPTAGTAFSNVNTTSPWVTGGGAALAVGNAVLNLTGLKAGYYMIALGGSCPDLNLNGQACGTTPPGGTGVQLTIATSAVPVPAAVWLFGSAIVGFLGIGRRNKNRLTA